MPGVVECGGFGLLGRERARRISSWRIGMASMVAVSSRALIGRGCRQLRSAVLADQHRPKRSIVKA